MSKSSETLYTVYATPPASPSYALEERGGLAVVIKSKFLSIKQYHATYLLLEISNNVLANIYIKRPIEDPLTYVRRSRKQEYNIKLLAAKALTSDESAEDGMDGASGLYEEEMGGITSEILKVEAEAIKLEIAKISSLIGDREDLNSKLLGAFPFAKRGLSKTFIEKYNKRLASTSSEDEIISSLMSIRALKQLPVSEKVVKFLNLFDIEGKTIQDGSRYLQKTHAALSHKIDNMIGRKVTDEDVSYYRKVHRRDLEGRGMQRLSDAELEAEVRQYISANSERIKVTMDGIAKYMFHPEYLDLLSQQDFLTQVICYRKILRDLQKTLLVDGSADQRNVPPGINTTIKYTYAGSSTILLGELGSYEDMSQAHLATLRNYGNYFQNPIVFPAVEKEEEFKALQQIEAIRNPAHILMQAMFFELAKVEFDPSSHRRVNPNEKLPYRYEFIADQLPMAMSGAVMGSVFINNAVSKMVEDDFPYDYRLEGKRLEGKLLHKKQNNLLFDYLIWKSLQGGQAEVVEEGEDAGERADTGESAPGPVEKKAKQKPEPEIDAYGQEVQHDTEGKIESIGNISTKIFATIIHDWYGFDIDFGGVENLMGCSVGFIDYAEAGMSMMQQSH